MGILLWLVNWGKANPKYVLYIVGGLVILSFIGYQVYSYGSRVWADSQRQEYLRGRKEAENDFKEREVKAMAEIAAEKKSNQEEAVKNENTRKLLAAREKEFDRAWAMLNQVGADISARANAQIQAGHTVAQSLDAAGTTASIIKLSRELAADPDWRNHPAGVPNPK